MFKFIKNTHNVVLLQVLIFSFCLSLTAGEFEEINSEVNHHTMPDVSLRNSYKDHHRKLLAFLVCEPNFTIVRKAYNLDRHSVPAIDIVDEIGDKCPAGYNHVYDVIGIDCKYFEKLNNNEQQFVLAHELAHRQCNHVHVTSIVTWVYLIGMTRKVAQINTLHKKGLVALGGSIVGILTQLALSRLLEKHADLTAADKIGAQGGITLFNKMKYEWKEEYMPTTPLEQEAYNSYSPKRRVRRQYIRRTLLYLSQPFRSHPLSIKRVKYLEEFQKNPNSCWWYNLIREKK